MTLCFFKAPVSGSLSSEMPDNLTATQRQVLALVRHAQQMLERQKYAIDAIKKLKQAAPLARQVDPPINFGPLAEELPVPIAWTPERVMKSLLTEMMPTARVTFTDCQKQHPPR